MADQMATADRNDCDARATAAGNECDATTEEYEHDDDLAAPNVLRYEGPKHHIDETLQALVSTGLQFCEGSGSGSASSSTLGASAAHPEPVLLGSIGDVPIPAHLGL